MINTTLYRIIHSELIKLGHNEIFNNGKITTFDSNFSFMKKVLKFDDDIELIVNDKFFNGITLDDLEHDRKFKRQFLNKFINHSPAQQTVEAFSMKVCYILMNNIDYLNNYYTNLDLFIEGKSISESKGSHEGINDNRNATSTLPQNEVNINVDDTILKYADDNTITRNKEKGNKEDTSISKRYDLSTLKSSRNMLEDIFNEFEKECFLLIW